MGWRCFFVRKQLALLVGDDLPDRPKRAVNAHLDACPNCRQHLAALKRTHAAMFQCVAEHPVGGTSLWPALRSRLDHAGERRPAQPSWLPIGSLAAASVALAVMLWDQSRGSTWRPVSAGVVSARTGQLVSGQKSEVRDQRSEVRGRKSDVPTDWTSEVASGQDGFRLERARPVGYSTREF